MDPEEMARQMIPMFETVFRGQNRVTLAAAALRGLLGRADTGQSPEIIAAHAVALADAVLAQLERGPPS